MQTYRCLNPSSGRCHLSPTPHRSTLRGLNAVNASAKLNPTKGRVVAPCDPLAGFGELTSPPAPNHAQSLWSIDRQSGELVRSPNTPMTARAAAPARIKGWVLAMLGSRRCTCAWLWSCVTAPLTLAPPLLGGSQTGCMRNPSEQRRGERQMPQHYTHNRTTFHRQWISILKSL